MRIIPRIHEDINEEWISDKSRFSYDGLKRQRLTSPYMKTEAGGLAPCTWEDALVKVAEKLMTTAPEDIAVVAGDLIDAEALVAAKDLFNKLNCDNLMTERGFPSSGAGTDIRSNYLFNTSIAGIEEADALLIVGACPRFEAPLVNARIRKAWMHNELDVAMIGEPTDLTFTYDHLGNDISVLRDIINGEHEYADVLLKAKRPMIIVGANPLTGQDGQSLMDLVSAGCDMLKKAGGVDDGWRMMNVLQQTASQVAALDVGYKAGLDKLGAPKVVYMMGADSGKVTRESLPADAFVVYQGHHGDAGAVMADVILPGAAYTEKTGTFVNMEGRSQETRRALTPPALARDDWKIIRALSEISGNTLPYDTLEEVRNRMTEIAPHLTRYGSVETANFFAQSAQFVEPAATVSNAPISPALSSLAEFYMTDSISRASQTMARCIKSVKE